MKITKEWEEGGILFEKRVATTTSRTLASGRRRSTSKTEREDGVGQETGVGASTGYCVLVLLFE